MQRKTRDQGHPRKSRRLQETDEVVGRTRRPRCELVHLHQSRRKGGQGRHPARTLEKSKKTSKDRVQVKRSTQLHSRLGEKRRLPIFMVDLNKEGLEKMKKVEFILNPKVRQKKN